MMAMANGHAGHDAARELARVDALIDETGGRVRLPEDSALIERGAARSPAQLRQAGLVRTLVIFLAMVAMLALASQFLV